MIAAMGAARLKMRNLITVCASTTRSVNVHMSVVEPAPEATFPQGMSPRVSALATEDSPRRSTADVRKILGRFIKFVTIDMGLIVT
jgi:hypothetical protein